MSKLGLQWTGWDGSVWDLTSGLVRARIGGVRGLGKPDVQEQTSTTARQDGQTFQGWTLKERTVFLPLKYFGAANTDVAGVQASFWKSMQIGEYGVLRVMNPDTGSWRELRCRATDDSSWTVDTDPFVYGTPFGLTLVADQPWWEGPAVEALYNLGTAVGDDFLADDPVTKGDYVIAIVSANGATSQQVTNPGDIEAFVTWSVEVPVGGATSSFRLGVGGHYVGGPIALTAGQKLWVETDRRRQLAYRAATRLDSPTDRVTRFLTEADFAGIPKGGSVQLDLSVVGQAAVRGSFRPRYERALGR